MVERPESHSIEYWRARADALEDELDALRELVCALSRSLPVEKAAAIAAALGSGALLLPAGEEARSPLPSDVKTEIERVWDSLLPPWRER